VSCVVRQLSLDAVVALKTCSERTTEWVILVPCPGAVAVVLQTLSSLPKETTRFAKFFKVWQILGIFKGQRQPLLQRCGKKRE